MSVPTPTPAAADETDEVEGGEAPDSTPDPEGESGEDPVREAVGQELDALSEAGEQAAEEAAPDSPFDGDDEIEVDLADTNIGEPVDEGDGEEGASPFDGIDAPAPSETSKGPEEMAKAAEQMDEPMDEIIVEGFARLSVVGLDESDGKDDLEQEFQEVFEAFQLGKFGDEVLKEYVFTDDDVDPLWGFAGAMLLCTTVVVWRRPDGDRIIQNANNSLNDLATQIRS